MKKLFKLSLLSIFFVGVLSGCSKGNTNSSFSESPLSNIGLLKPHFLKEGKRGETEIVGHNLSLESSINIVYYVKNSSEYTNRGLIVYPTYQEEYGLDKGNPYRVERANEKYVVGEETYDVYYFDKVAAKEMGVYFYALSYIEVAENSYIYSSVDRYSVLQYCHTFKDSDQKVKEFSNVNLGDVTKSILSYGGMVQRFFLFNTDSYVDEPCYEITLKNGHFRDGFSTQLVFSNSRIFPVPDLKNEHSKFINWYNYMYGTISFTLNGRIANSHYNKFDKDLTIEARVINYDEWEIQGNKISKYLGNNEFEIIPSETEDNNPITDIGDNCFEGSNLKEIYVSSSLTDLIKESTLTNCSIEHIYYEQGNAMPSIASLSFTHSVSFNGPHLIFINNVVSYFNGYEKDVAIPAKFNDVTITKIEEAAFKGQPLKTLTLPSTINEIPQEAFADCNKLESLNWDYITSIQVCAFANATSLSKVFLSKNVTEMGYRCFDGCSCEIFIEYSSENELPFSWDPLFLESCIGTCHWGVVMDNTSSFLANKKGELLSYEGNDEEVYIPLYYYDIPITKISTYCFNHAESVRKIYFSQFIKTVEINAIEYCENLTYIDLNNVETLEKDCITLCGALSSLFIPISATNIDINFIGSSSIQLNFEGSDALYPELKNKYPSANFNCQKPN